MDQHRHTWSRMSITSPSTAVSGSGDAARSTGRSVIELARSGGPGPAAAEPATSGVAGRARRPTLLVVDDEPDVLELGPRLLRIDYRVITFQRGAEALEYLRSGQVADVILSDQRMPEMTGVEVLRQAKAIRPETTRLLFTAYTDIRTVIDAINQGHVFRYIAKPCDPDELAVVVRQAVEHHNLIVEKNRLLAELKESNARLLEANRLKGAFIEVASHELNTPVTVVLGMIELWKMSQGQSASPAERQWVDRIGAAAGRLARTVERMLKLVRNREFSQSLDAQTDRAGAARAAGDRGLVSLSRAARPGGVRVDRARPGPARSRPVQDLRRAHQPSGQRGQVHARRRHDPARSPGRADGRRLDPRLRPRPGRGRFRRPTSSTSSSRSSPASTRSATPPATTSSASAGSGWASGWSRRSSSCTAAASRSPARPAPARPSRSCCRDHRPYYPNRASSGVGPDWPLTLGMARSLPGLPRFDHGVSTPPSLIKTTMATV